MAGWSARSHEPEFLNLRLFSQSRSVWKFREHFFAFSELSWKIPAGSIPDASETQPDSALLGCAKSVITVTMSIVRARLIIEKKPYILKDAGNWSAWVLDSEHQNSSVCNAFFKDESWITTHCQANQVLSILQCSETTWMKSTGWQGCQDNFRSDLKVRKDGLDYCVNGLWLPSLASVRRKTKNYVLAICTCYFWR